MTGMDLNKVMDKLDILGWDPDRDDWWIGDDGYVYYRRGDEGDPDQYLAQIDPYTGSHRYKDNNSGGLWSDWNRW